MSHSILEADPDPGLEPWPLAAGSVLFPMPHNASLLLNQAFLWYQAVDWRQAIITTMPTRYNYYAVFYTYENNIFI